MRVYARNLDHVAFLEVSRSEHVAAYVTSREIGLGRVDGQALSFLCCVYHLLSPTVQVEWAEEVLEKAELDVARADWCLGSDRCRAASFSLAAVASGVIRRSTEFVTVVETLMLALICRVVQPVQSKGVIDKHSKGEQEEKFWVTLSL